MPYNFQLSTNTNNNKNQKYAGDSGDLILTMTKQPKKLNLNHSVPIFFSLWKRCKILFRFIPFYLYQKLTLKTLKYGFKQQKKKKKTKYRTIKLNSLLWCVILTLMCMCVCVCVTKLPLLYLFTIAWKSGLIEFTCCCCCFFFSLSLRCGYRTD